MNENYFRSARMLAQAIILLVALNLISTNINAQSTTSG